MAGLVFLGMAFSFSKFISSSDTLTKREAAILKICPPAIITSSEVIIAEYDAILGQLEREDFYNHLSNYTNSNYNASGCLNNVLICRRGPLVRNWAMRFEAKHNYFKKLVERINNFKNISYSLARRHQALQAYLLQSSAGNFLRMSLEVGPGTARLKKVTFFIFINTFEATCKLFWKIYHFQMRSSIGTF